MGRGSTHGRAATVPAVSEHDHAPSAGGLVATADAALAAMSTACAAWDARRDALASENAAWESRRILENEIERMHAQRDALARSVAAAGLDLAALSQALDKALTDVAAISNDLEYRLVARSSGDRGARELRAILANVRGILDTFYVDEP